MYGYRFAEIEHPNPHKAEQGVKVKLLEPDPMTAPIVKMIFTDCVVNGLSITAILEKLNEDLDSYPPPQSPDPKRRTGMWGRSSVWEILHTPSTRASWCGTDASESAGERWPRNDQPLPTCLP